MFTVKITNWMGQKGNNYWLRGTIWTSDNDRANTFATRDEARAALDKARKFNPKAAKAAAIVEE